MPNLFTVRMIAKKIVSFFDAAGNKTGEREEHIPQVYHDLPHPTALTYQRQFPDNQVVIEAQAFEPERLRQAVSYKQRNYEKAESSRQSIGRIKREKPAERENDEQRAAQAGDMAAAINAEMNND